MERVADGAVCVACEADVGPAPADMAHGPDARTPPKTNALFLKRHATASASWDSPLTASAATSSPVTVTSQQSSAGASRHLTVRRPTNSRNTTGRGVYEAPIQSSDPPQAVQASRSIPEFETALEDVELCRRKDGTLWQLGGGSFGAGELLQPNDPHRHPDLHQFCPAVAHTRLRRAAVYKAVKGVETVAVKACGVLLRQEDQVCGYDKALSNLLLTTAPVSSSLGTPPSVSLLSDCAADHDRRLHENVISCVLMWQNVSRRRTHFTRRLPSSRHAATRISWPTLPTMSTTSEPGSLWNTWRCGSWSMTVCHGPHPGGSAGHAVRLGWFSCALCYAALLC